MGHASLPGCKITAVPESSLIPTSKLVLVRSDGLKNNIAIDLSFKSGITTKITIAGSELKAHKIPPSILTLQDDGTVGVKAVNEENIVIFYPTTSVKDTIDGIWVSGLPDKVNLIVTGQEYVAVGESVSN